MLSKIIQVFGSEPEIMVGWNEPEEGIIPTERNTFVQRDT